MNTKELYMVRITTKRYFLKKVYFFANKETIVNLAYIVEETKVSDKNAPQDQITFDILKENLQEISVHNMCNDLVMKIEAAEDRTLSVEYPLSKDSAFELKDKTENLLTLNSDELDRFNKD